MTRKNRKNSLGAQNNHQRPQRIIRQKLQKFIYPSFEEAQFVLLLVVTLFVPVDGSPLLFHAIQFVATSIQNGHINTSGSESQLASIVLFEILLVTLRFPFLIPLLRKKKLSPALKVGILMLIYIVVGSCAIFASYDTPSSSSLQGTINHLITELVAALFIVRVYGTLFLAFLTDWKEDKKYLQPMISSFNDTQATPIQFILIGVLGVFFNGLLNYYGYNVLQIITLSYAYSYIAFILIMKAVQAAFPESNRRIR